jgi:hypothetical protein
LFLSARGGGGVVCTLEWLLIDGNAAEKARRVHRSDIKFTLSTKRCVKNES